MLFVDFKTFAFYFWKILSLGLEHVVETAAAVATEDQTAAQGVAVTVVAAAADPNGDPLHPPVTNGVLCWF